MGRKSIVINLSAEEREYLETQTRARTIQAQTVNRARILLLKAEGCTIHEIADKVGINRKSVMLCLNKYAEGGVENALFDAPGRAVTQRSLMMRKHGSSILPVRNRLISVMLLKHGLTQNLPLTLTKMRKPLDLQGFLRSIKAPCTVYWTKRK